MAEHGAAKIRPGVYSPQDIPFKRKARSGSFEWGGSWPDGGAASVPENRPRLIINGRLRSGDIKRRGGQTRIGQTTSPASGTVVGLFDFRIPRPYSLYFVQDGCPSVSSTVGYSIGSFDFNQSPSVQPLVYLAAAQYNETIAPFSGKLFAAKDNEVVEVLVYRAPFGGETLQYAGNSMERPLFTLESGLTHTAAMQAFEGELFLLAIHSSGAGSCKVQRYDGVTLEDDAGSPTGVFTGAGLFRELLIVGYGGSPNYISTRDADGTWANVSPSAGTVAMLGPHTSCSFRDKFYFAGNTSDVWGYDGTTLAAIGTATTGLNASALVKDMCVHNGVMYVLWQYANASAIGIASFDGTTWTPVAKNLKSQISALTGVHKIRSYGDSLVVAATKAIGTILVSQALNPVGTYTAYDLDSPSGQIFDMQAF